MTTCQEMLAVLKEFFQQSDIIQEQVKLWDVLSALRGPDAHRENDVKNATTGVIRHAVFGSNSKVTYTAVVRSDTEGSVLVRRGLEAGHFVNHAQAAFEALGLKWDDMNTE